MRETISIVWASYKKLHPVLHAYKRLKPGGLHACLEMAKIEWQGDAISLIGGSAVLYSASNFESRILDHMGNRELIAFGFGY